ncbi:phage tail tip lysozyme [Lawsonibacter sp. JLR.KK007]|jgi:hypothetical protein|uniref:phage tail tip lysozyme n=1 Tax=Lawsonibacter sp. JLR.KK007 TaxID=3114293 RepID=UPI002FF33B4F
MALIGNNNPEKMFNFLRQQGFTEAGSAAVVGNGYAESGCSPINLQNNGNRELDMTDEQYTAAVDNGTYTNFVNDKYGYGIFQWTYWSRKQNLLNYAKSKGVSIGDLEMHMNFLMQELNAGYKPLLNILRTSNSVSECSNAFMLQFERPANQSVENQNKRVSYGREFYNKFCGKGGTTMGYTNSPLVDCVKMSPNHSGKRTHRIDHITPHCVVGQCSAERIGDCFPAGREASCNYGIGYDGRVCLIVDEANRSWCTSSNANDQRAITIECASDSTHPYAFKDACYKKLVKLCIDICQRNGIKKMLWINNKEKALNYEPKAGEGIFTVHRWYANKSCPGDWMYNRMGQLCDEVNAGLNGGSYNPPEQGAVVNYQAKVIADDGLNCRIQPYVANNNLIMTYPAGTILTITKEQNGWGYTGTGWVSLDYVEKIQNTVEGDDYMTRDQILKEIGDKYITTYSELPDWAKPDMRELLNNGTINGGTDYATDPDDINMFMSDIKAIIVAKRMMEKR